MEQGTRIIMFQWQHKTSIGHAKRKWKGTLFGQISLKNQKCHKKGILTSFHCASDNIASRRVNTTRLSFIAFMIYPVY